MYQNMNKFKEMWVAKGMNNEEFAKAQRLSLKEIRDIRNYIKALQDQSAPSSTIITHLQKFTPKLEEKWKAERAYFTEMKRLETQTIKDAGKDLGITKYRVILSPSACDICRKATNNGRKTFDKSDMQKSGYGHVPPFHPNCYCAAIPK
jgi:F like protein